MTRFWDPDSKMSQPGMIWYLPIKLSVTEDDDLTTDTGLRIKKNYSGIGTLFTPQLIIMNFHDINEIKKIY